MFPTSLATPAPPPMSVKRADTPITVTEPPLEDTNMEQWTRSAASFLCLLTFKVPISKSYENAANATPKAHDEYRHEHENASPRLRRARTQGWAYKNDKPERGGWPVYENDEPYDHVKGYGDVMGAQVSTSWPVSLPADSPSTTGKSSRGRCTTSTAA